MGSVDSADAAMKKVASFPFFSSGSKALDGLLGGGFRAGSLTEVIGRSNAGKSQLAMQASLEAATQEYRTFYLDTEGSFRPERLEQIADARGWETRGALERVTYMRCDSAAEQMEAVSRMQERPATSGCRLVVVDTLTRNFSVELPGRSNMASRQGALGVHLSEMARDAYINGRAYLLTNRVTFGPSHDVGIGGKTVEQMVDATILLERQGTKVKATKAATGESVNLDVGRSGIE